MADNEMSARFIAVHPQYRLSKRSMKSAVFAVESTPHISSYPCKFHFRHSLWGTIALWHSVTKSGNIANCWSSFWISLSNNLWSVTLWTRKSRLRISSQAVQFVLWWSATNRTSSTPGRNAFQSCRKTGGLSYSYFYDVLMTIRTKKPPKNQLHTHWVSFLFIF